jgi:hypothetical protein
MDGWIIHHEIYARIFFFFPHIRKFLRLYKNQSQKKKPTVLSGGFVVYCFGHTHTREREDDNCLSWEKEKDVEDTAVKIHRTLV